MRRDGVPNAALTSYVQVPQLTGEMVRDSIYTYDATVAKCPSILYLLNSGSEFWSG